MLDVSKETSISILKEVMDIIDSFNPEARKKLAGVEIQLSPEATSIAETGWVRARYYNHSKTILIYSSLIKDKKDLKEIILHELGHYFGLSHKDIRH